MFHQLLSKVYELPGFVFFFFMILCILLWGALGHVLSGKRGWVTVNRVLCVPIVAAILFITLAVRGTRGETAVVWQPFAVLELAKQYPDVYNQIILNMVLFFPLGAVLPYAFPQRTRFRVLRTVAAALVLSVAIELLQYWLSCGYTEVDDVLLNVSGALIGTLAYGLTTLLKHTDEHVL